MTTEAAFPPNEAARLRTLGSYQILDTLPEQAYDDITHLASRVCDTPIALVSLIDADRQWFKSKVGIDVAETSRDIAFCSHAILEPGELFIVEDATKDERFAGNPLVMADPMIRFYAGAPLVTSEGHALGTLCVIDRKARKLEQDQARSLRVLSRLVVAQLELRRSVAMLEESSRELQRTHSSLERRTDQIVRSRNELADLCRMLEGQADVIERDLQRAEIIQRSLLPNDPPSMTDFCVQTLYRPGRSIGGDLYDVVGIGDRYVALVIADATGHGVSAAMLSVLFKHRLDIIDEETGDPYEPTDALARINAALCRDVSAPGVFVTAAFCILDTQERTLTVASAGHPPLIWLRSDGATERIGKTGPALGLSPDAKFSERRIELRRGDRVLLYTDGLFDVAGAASLEVISETLREAAGDPRALEKVLMRVSQGQAREDRDDVTLLLLDASPGESHFDETQETFGLKTTPESERPSISHAEGEAATFLCLRGRVTWMLGQGLLDIAISVIESDRPIVVDLAGCEYLDSTLLGTLHEAVARADARGSSFRLQRVPTEILAAFEELSMEVVLSHVRDEPLPVPEMRTPVEFAETDAKRQQLRLLKAHEMLGELSEENREQFGPVVEALRSDIARR